MLMRWHSSPVFKRRCTAAPPSNGNESAADHCRFKLQRVQTQLKAPVKFYRSAKWLLLVLVSTVLLLLGQDPSDSKLAVAEAVALQLHVAQAALCETGLSSCRLQESFSAQKPAESILSRGHAPLSLLSRLFG